MISEKIVDKNIENDDVSSESTVLDIPKIFKY